MDSGISQLGRVPRKPGRLEDAGEKIAADRPPADATFRELTAYGAQAPVLRTLDPLDPGNPTPRVGSDPTALRSAARRVLAAAHGTLMLRLPDHAELIGALDQLDRLSR